MKMNLQYFAEEAETEEVTAEPEAVEEGSADEQQPEVKTFTEQEVQKMIKDRLAREQKAKEKAVEEAEKLAKMNATEKEQYAVEQMKKRLEEFEKKETFYSLSKEASKMLAEHDIQADDDLLALVVKENADGTKQAVDSFAQLINAKVEQGVKNALSGKSPKVNATGGALSKEKILSTKDAGERIRLIQQNPHLFKK